MSDLIHFTVSPQDDQAGVATRAILVAHLAHQRTKASRQFWVHALALLGGVVALCLVFPEAASRELRAAVLALWGACGVCVLGTLASELRWQRRETHLLAANGSTKRRTMRRDRSPERPAG